MIDKIEHIIQKLKKAREKKGLSQRALAAYVGSPQSHISNIESGKVDLKTSSLVELSRVLDLELMLVPRTLITMIEALTKETENPEDYQEPPPAYRLNEDDLNESDLDDD